MLLNENPCKGQIKDGWKSCSTCDHVNSVYEGNCEYVCLEELRYQAQRELLGKVVELLWDDAGVTIELCDNPHFEQSSIVRYAGMRDILIEIALRLQKELQG